MILSLPNFFDWNLQDGVPCAVAMHPKSERLNVILWATNGFAALTGKKTYFPEFVARFSRRRPWVEMVIHRGEVFCPSFHFRNVFPAEQSASGFYHLDKERKT